MRIREEQKRQRDLERQQFLYNEKLRLARIEKEKQDKLNAQRLEKQRQQLLAEEAARLRAKQEEQQRLLVEQQKAELAALKLKQSKQALALGIPSVEPSSILNKAKAPAQLTL